LSWNYNINLPDVNLICALRNAYRPQLEEESRQLGKVVRDIIILGLSTCGCPFRNTELGQILDKEEKQKGITTSSGNNPRSAKRLRGVEDEELALVREFDDCVQRHDNQSEPLSKHQEQSNFLYCDSSQGSRDTQRIFEVSAGMNNPTMHSPEANNEASVLREAPNISEQNTSVPTTQLDSHSLVIPNVEARNISLDGNMQGIRPHY
jgi:hypothetical protein